MPTVTVTEIVSDVLDSILIGQPMLSDFAHDFTATPLKKGQQAIAHIATVPDVDDYDNSKGYGHADNKQETKDLYEDIPVTVTKHKHVDLNVSYVNSIADKKHLYEEAIQNAGYALGRQVVQDVLALAVAANITEETEESAVNYDRDTLGGIRKAMNKKGASPFGRIGLVNSDAYEALDADTRIASRDYYGQQTGGSALGVLKNVAGFKSVYEYPELPDNSEDLNGVFCDPRCFVLKTGIPIDIEAIAQDLGVPKIASFEVVTSPVSGLSLLAIKWMEPGTFDVKITLTLIYGIAAGAQGGSAGDKTDYTGHRVVEVASSESE